MTGSIPAAFGRSAVVLALAVAVAAAGCSGSPSDGAGTARWSGTVDTAADGRVTVTNTGGGAWTRDTVEARRTLLLGEAGITGGSEATTFGDLTGLAVDDRGRIYVGDRVASTVRAFGPEGEHLRLIGGEGEGPGEFRLPVSLAAGPGGQLFVADADGLTVLEPDSAGAVPTRQVRSSQPSAFPQVFRRLRVDCRGTVYFPHTTGREKRQLYVLVDSSSTVRDTLAVPDFDVLPDGAVAIRTSDTGGRMVFGLDRPPLAPVPWWDVTEAGHLVVGVADRYRLTVISAEGDTVGAFSRDAARRRIPDAVRRDSARALRTRLDSLPVPTSEVSNLPESVAAVQLPDRYPAYLSVYRGRDGAIRVERPPPSHRRDVTPYDVFDRRGVYLGTVVLPGRFDRGRGSVTSRMRARPVFTDDAVYGVVTDSATGVQRIARFSYDLPDREDGAPAPPGPPCASAGPEGAR